MLAPTQPTDTEDGLLPALCRTLTASGKLTALHLRCHLLPSGCTPLGGLPVSLRSLSVGCIFGCEPGMQPALSAALSRWASFPVVFFLAVLRFKTGSWDEPDRGAAGNAEAGSSA